MLASKTRLLALLCEDVPKIELSRRKENFLNHSIYMWFPVHLILNRPPQTWMKTDQKQPLKVWWNVAGTTNWQPFFGPAFKDQEI